MTKTLVITVPSEIEYRISKAAVSKVGQALNKHYTGKKIINRPAMDEHGNPKTWGLQRAPSYEPDPTIPNSSSKELEDAHYNIHRSTTVSVWIDVYSDGSTQIRLR